MIDKMLTDMSDMIVRSFTEEKLQDAERWIIGTPERISLAHFVHKVKMWCLFNYIAFQTSWKLYSYKEFFDLLDHHFRLAIRRERFRRGIYR